MINIREILRFQRIQIGRILKKDLIQVFSWTSLSTIIAIVAKIVKAKIVAVIIGPAGIAYMGQLTNFMTLFYTISTGGITGGVTKYIAEFKSSDSECKKYFSTGMLIILVFSFISSAILLIYSSTFARKLFQSDEYSSIIVIFSISILAVALNNFLLAITNGFKEYKKYISGGIFRSISILVLSVVLVLIYKVYGALLAMVLSQAIVLLITCFMIRKLPWFTLQNFIPAYDKEVTKKLLSYSMVAAATFFVGPGATLMIRSFVISSISVDAAGLWDGSKAVSMYVTMVITQGLSVYLVPRFSELTDKSKIRREILNTYKIIVPLMLFAYTSIFLLKDFAIGLLLSEKFLPMGELLFFQFLGDSIRVIALVISIQMLAKAKLKTLVITEIVFNVLSVGLAYYGLIIFGLRGIAIAHTVNFTIYLVVMVILFRSTLFAKNDIIGDNA